MLQHFDIIIMDLQMPFLNGFDSSLKIKATMKTKEPTRDLPFIVALSSYMDSKVEKKCFDSMIDLCT
jgi:CheY-like chemotaxis protein